MPTAATIADIHDIAQRLLVEQGGKILGITASQPAYVQIPDEDDPDAVFEFVVDVQVIEGATARIVATGGAAGSTILRDVIIAHEAVGNVIADIHVPVEMQRSVSGQLQVVGRAKVALPALRLDEFTYSDLHLEHVAEGQVVDGVLVDGFCIPLSGNGQYSGATSTSTITPTARLSFLGELDTDDSGSVVGLGVNALQRTVVTYARTVSLSATEALDFSETEAVI